MLGRGVCSDGDETDREEGRGRGCLWVVLMFEEGTLGDFELRKGRRFEAQLLLGFQASFGLPGSLAAPPSACFCATGHFDRDPIGPWGPKSSSTRPPLLHTLPR